MTNVQTVKTYTKKSNAVRAIKAVSKLASFDFDKIIENIQGGFIVDFNKVTEYEIKARANAIVLTTQAKSKTAKIFAKVKPCKQVWFMADAMLGSTRKDVIKACVDAGINCFTARTQYQLWFTCHHKTAVK